MPASQFRDANRGRVLHIGPLVSDYHPWGGKKPSDHSRRRNLHSLTVTDRILPPHDPRWGAIRIVGELRALGIDVSASTVRSYRRQALRRPVGVQN